MTASQIRLSKTQRDVLMMVSRSEVRFSNVRTVEGSWSVHGGRQVNSNTLQSLHNRGMIRKDRRSDGGYWVLTAYGQTVIDRIAADS